MKRKQLLSLILAMCITISTSVVAFASENDGSNLEKAIVSAKNIITIPEEYSDFSYYYNENTEENESSGAYTLDWSNKDGESISIQVDDNGNILEYHKFDSNNDLSGLAKISKEDAKAIAEKFMQKSVKFKEGSIKIIDDRSNLSQSSDYEFKFGQFVNNIPVSFNTIDLSINKYNGEVTSLIRNNNDVKNYIFSSKDSIINKEAAKKAYLEKIGIDLKYYSRYDYKNKKLNVFPAYSIKQDKLQGIDAKTSEVVNIYSDNILNKGLNNSSKLMTEDAAVSDGKESTLTKEEINEIQKTAQLISKEDAEKVIKDNFDSLKANDKVNNASLEKSDYVDSKYIWNISFENGNGSVDAKTGELLSFYFYDNNEEVINNISYSEAKNKCDSFLKKVAAEKYKKVKYIPEEENAEGNYYTFKYVRMVNGYEYTNNYLSISIDKTTGKIINYENQWFTNITFPSLNNVISKDIVFDKISDDIGFDLQYEKIDKDKVSLIYNFSNLQEQYLLDPMTGVRIGYDGKKYKENNLPTYTDITGHAYENVIKELLNNGYYLEGDKFNPDSYITQANFFKYLYTPDMSYYDEDELYEMLIGNKIIKSEEKSPDHILTNGEVAKYVVRYLNYEPIAKNSQIFVNPFKDNVSNDYKGYAAICYGLDIIKGDSNGNFNEKGNMTNGQTAQVIYNLLKIEK